MDDSNRHHDRGNDLGLSHPLGREQVSRGHAGRSIGVMAGLRDPVLLRVLHQRKVVLPWLSETRAAFKGCSQGLGVAQAARGVGAGGIVGRRTKKYNSNCLTSTVVQGCIGKLLHVGRARALLARLRLTGPFFIGSLSDP